MGEPDPEAVDYYSRIGVDPEADIETIERQRKQADRRFSPMSTSPEADEKRHMQINAASNVLEDPERREQYDALYETFGRVEGTAIYETFSGPTAEAIVEDDRLLEHLRGFVEVLGPVDGAREFQRYYQELDPPVPEEFEQLELPPGYGVEDAGFGVAAWSFRSAGQPCAFDLWLTGGHDLWRTALEEPDDVPERVAELKESREQVADAGTPTTRLEEGPVETVTDELPSEYVREEPGSGRRFPSVEIGTPTRRVGRALAYLGETTLWASGSTAVAAASGMATWIAGIVLFVPLLAVGLLVESSMPGVAAWVQSTVGAPLADPDAPLATVSAVHYLTTTFVVAVAMGLGGRLFVAIHDRRSGGLPRDAWLVFGIALAALAAALFVGIGARGLSRPTAVAAAGLVTAVTFQAAMDVGAPQVLSLLCRSVATIAFALVALVAAALTAETALLAVAPDLAYTLYALVPVFEPPLASLANAELVIVGFGALSLVPLMLTTMYSVAYAVESVALRWRSGPQSS